MKLDTTVWENIERLRTTCVNNAKTLASFSALNFFTMIYYKNWYVMVVNLIAFITALFTIISKSKYDKLPPK